MKQYAESARAPALAGRITTAIADAGLVAACRFFFWSLALGLAFTQAPLYTSNQNTKFLVGLADAGLGFLTEDWLANMTDPLPVFSLLVSLTYRYLPEYMFYVFNILIFGVYLHSLAAIAAQIYGIERRRPTHLTFLMVIVALHSYAFDSFAMRAFGLELGQLLYYGVAEQHMIGRIFQPSVFGVFMLLSVYAFLRREIFLAAFLVVLPSIVHPAYLINSALLTLAYMVAVLREEKSGKKCLAVGVYNLVLILPLLIYYFVYFRPTSPEIWRKAAEILVHVRSPHHMNPEVWLGGVAYAKLALILVALFLVRKTRLFLVMLLPLLLVIVVSVAQWILKDDSLAALTPWRISVFLVPLSLGIIVARLISSLSERFAAQVHRNRRRIAAANSTAIALLVFYGVNAQVKRHQKYYSGDSIAMMNFVKETKSSGEHYLVPVELEDFRLYTGAPTFVTFKSGPVKDVEYLEWYKRFAAANDFYSARASGACEVLHALEKEYKLTHLVVNRAEAGADCGNLHELYKDEHYHVYRIRNENAAPGSDRAA
jgi:hypothetical protein